VWSRDQIDTLIKDIRAWFDQLLDVEIGMAALQIRHISNVGYGIDNFIGLNGELRDTLEFTRQILQSEIFLRSYLEYDHYYTRLLNRKEYSPSPKEIENNFEQTYESELKYDIKFYPAWDTVAMDVDAARKADAIAYKVKTTIHGKGEVWIKLDQKQIEEVFNSIVEDEKYRKIKKEAEPSINKAMTESLQNISGQIDAVDAFDYSSIIEFVEAKKYFIPRDENNKLKVSFRINQPIHYKVKYGKLEIYLIDKKIENSVLVYRSSESIELKDVTTFEWNGIMNQGSFTGEVIKEDNAPFIVKTIVCDNADFTGQFINSNEYEASLNPSEEDIKNAIIQIFNNKYEQLNKLQEEKKEEITNMLDVWMEELKDKGYFLPLFAGTDNVYLSPGFSKFFSVELDESIKTVSRYAKIYNKDLEILPFVLQQDWIKHKLKDENLEPYTKEIYKLITTQVLDSESNSSDTKNENSDQNQENQSNSTKISSIDHQIADKIDADLVTYMEKQVIQKPNSIIANAMIMELPALTPIGNIFKVQSNNFTIQLNNGKEIGKNIDKNKINIPGLKSIIANKINGKNYSNLEMDLFFVDKSQMIDLKFKDGKSFDCVDVIFKKWENKNSTNGTNRILLSYQTLSKDVGQFTPIGLSISNNLNQNQVPWIVAEYIQNQIMIPETNYLTSVKNTVNAFKNAFDQRFKDKLIEMGPKMLDFMYYYKGHTYITHSYSYFKYTEDANRVKLSKNLEYWHHHGLETSYCEVYLKNWPEKKAQVFDIKFGHETNYMLNKTFYDIKNLENLYVKTDADLGRGRHVITDYIDTYSIFDKNLLFNLDNSELYDSLDKIPEKSGTYKFVQQIKKSPVVLKLKLNESDKKKRFHIEEMTVPINYRSLYKIYSGKLKGVNRSQLWTEQETSEVTSEIGWSIGWGASKNQPTWCNVFACDLSNYIYGKVNGNYPVPYNKNANALYDYFINNITHYLNIKSKKSDIWKFIELGYPVYFSQSSGSNSTSGHIETGFPDKSKNIGNKRYYSDDLKSIYNNQKSNFCSIGAGGLVGYKTYNEYNFLKNADAFLYLGYLSKVY
jgi:hypothetical protein